MSAELYEMWIQSRQTESGEFDITDSVMANITQRNQRPRIFQNTWELFLLDFAQAKVWMQASVLAAGALAGLLRMAFIVYCGLFA